MNISFFTYRMLDLLWKPLILFLCFLAKSNQQMCTVPKKIQTIKSQTFREWAWSLMKTMVFCWSRPNISATSSQKWCTVPKNPKNLNPTHSWECAWPSLLRVRRIWVFWVFWDSIAFLHTFFDNHRVCWGNLGQYNVFVCFVVAASAGKRLGSPGKLQEALGCSGVLWGASGSSGDVWEAIEALGSSGRPWEALGGSGRLWESLGYLLK